VAESLAPWLAPDVQFHLVSRRRNRLWRMAEMAWAVCRYGRREQPVVIDVYSTLNFYYALICGLLCRWMGIRYWCVLHGGNLPGRIRRNPRLCQLLFGNAARLIAPSGYLQAAFRRAGFESEVIPNAIPITKYPYKQRDRVWPRLLWVRAFDAIYNPRMAIRVLHRLLERYPDTTLCMVGPDKDGSMQDCQQLAERLGVADRVRFTGRLPKAEWIALSADYDIFINTTNVDNTPVSVIEAMALGLPVVSTDVGGLPYLITQGEDGILVPADLDEEMAKAVVSLLERPEKAKRLASCARKKVENFSYEKVARQWKRLLIHE